MAVSRDKAPTAQETFMQMAQAAGLRGRILVTVGLIVLVRLGVWLPVPGIDRARFASDFQNSPFFGLLNAFSGGGLESLGIFALGILPFINASIAVQLLTAAIPSLEDLQKNEGEAGRRKISQITRYVALGVAVLQSTGIAIWTSAYMSTSNTDPVPFFIAKTMLALVAGAMFVMWVSELITERGIGNGASLLIFVNIVAVLPYSLGDTIELAQRDQGIVGRVLILVMVFLVTIVGIVFVQEGARRIPIISARRQVGRRLYRERTSYLPLRLNQGGVMPIIFASSFLILPGFLAEATNNPMLSNVGRYLGPNSPWPWLYVSFYLVLILFFSYFYASLTLDPADLSKNLKKMGSSIPGIRPGKATEQYISQVLNRLTFLGAIFLGLVATVPTAVEGATRVSTFQGLGATSLLIIVGVAIDTAKQIQTYVISQRYEGMVKQ